MVEPFGIGWLETYNDSTKRYDFSLIYDYIYDNYVREFKSNAFNLDGKPAIGFYDNGTFARNVVPDDERFSLRLIGCQPDDDWEYEVPNPGLSSQPVQRLSDKHLSKI